MELDNNNIDKLQNALTIISDFNQYTEEQFILVNDFLENYAQDFDEDRVESTFEDNEEIRDALLTIYSFGQEYVDDEDIIGNFQASLEDVLTDINNGSGMSF